MMDISGMSRRYEVRAIADGDVERVYMLCRGNPMYYKHLGIVASPEEVRRDLEALPGGKSLDDKYYVGFFDGPSLAAVMDLIAGYPDDKTAFIGFFMMEKSFQGKGVGSAIIGGVLEFLKKQGFGRAKLGYVKSNTQSARFWRKNGFLPTGEEGRAEGRAVVVMSRELNVGE